jgi:diguanylate cyclase (GGDEF)-like protein
MASMRRRALRIACRCPVLLLALGAAPAGAAEAESMAAGHPLGVLTALVAALALALLAAFSWWLARTSSRARRLARALQSSQDSSGELRQNEARLRGMIEGLAVGVTLHGPDGEIMSANAAALDLLATTRELLHGRRSIDLEGDALGEDGTPLAPGSGPLETVIATGRPVRDMVMGLRRPGAGERTWVTVSAEPRLAPDGGLSGVVCTFVDVTERRRAHEQIRHLAYHDFLTQLPNRELFLDRLGVAIVQALRRKRGAALLFVALDDFKLINDSLGHSVGDGVLRAIAQRLRGAVREADTVARFGGDEFTVLLPGVDEADDIARIAEKLHDAIRRPMDVDGRELALSASIGVALCPRDGRDTEALLKNADVAMYRAKELGHDQTEFYTSELGARVRHRLEVDARLRQAVLAGDLELHYQPIVSLATGRVEELEALVRWRDPQRGLILPGEFIPAAEAALGAILEVGAWVLRTVCRDLKQLSAELPDCPWVAINLSARQFYTGDLVEQVRSTLEEAGVAPARLELEITESVALRGEETTEKMMSRLKALGVRIAIDDFGTGYSSLSYLRRFPLDTLKVDRSFVQDAATNPDASGITRAVVGVGHQLGLRVVAEGVETGEQLRLLRLIGCDAAQGYFFSRALPRDALAEQLARIQEQWSREFPLA